MMSIVTKTGDNGTTGLLGGTRVSKASLRLHAYGTVDELNAILGLVLAEKCLPETLLRQIGPLQHMLFRLGADISAPATFSTQRIDPTDITLVEEWITSLEQRLPPLRNFIVPGGSRAAALLHHARTVCRRAERWATTLAEKEHINPQACIFLNRLSDHFFLAARWANHERDVQETRVLSSPPAPPAA